MRTLEERGPVVGKRTFGLLLALRRMIGAPVKTRCAGCPSAVVLPNRLLFCEGFRPCVRVRVQTLVGGRLARLVALA